MALTRDRLALCSWSLHPNSPQALIDDLGRIGLTRVQLALDPCCSNPDIWGNVGADLHHAGIEIVSGMMGAIGEDYSSPATIRKTGGFVPDETWDRNWAHAKKIAVVARDLGLDAVSAHAGFIPPDPNDPKWPVLTDRLRRIADLFGETFNGKLIFETGQETGDTLFNFLQQLDRENIGANFDPANMHLYAMDDPIRALRKVMPFVFQVHIKDATRPEQPGHWGKEVPIGQGMVDWDGFFAALNEANYQGNLVIEREAGDQRIPDIRTAIAFLESKLGA